MNTDHTQTVSQRFSSSDSPHQILEGTTWHARYQPNEHSFHYPYRYWGLSLNRLSQGDFPKDAGRLFKIFSAKKTALHSFDFTDYFDKNNLDDTNTANAEYLSKNRSIEDKILKNKRLNSKSIQHKKSAQNTAKTWLNSVNDEWQRLTESKPAGDILALVVGRNLGRYFSPVNFYIGFDKTGTASHLLAEVSNTPWKKSHYYGFRLENYQCGETVEFTHKKAFHVSPFNPLDQVYTWRFMLDSNFSSSALKKSAQNVINTLKISIHVSDDRGKVFAAGIDMQAELMTQANCKASISKNPVMNYSSMTRIYWHALQLYAVKKVPYIGYNQKLADSKQHKKDPSKQKPRSNSNNCNNSQSKGFDNMTDAKKLPTDRSETQVSNSVIKKITNSKLLLPVHKGIEIACRQIFYKALANFEFGHVTLIETYHKKPKIDQFGIVSSPKNQSNQQNQTVQSLGEVVGKHPLYITIKIHDPSFFKKIITGGSIALADSYINGEWEVDDLTALIRLGARNEKAMNHIEKRFSKLSKTLEFSKHRLRHNNVANSKANILAHYDIGNEMYQTFLDSSMMYSSAIYPTPHTTLADAQTLKLKTLCELLELSSDDKVIEIGTGWGGFAIYAATHYGCHVTTTTISDAQYEEAKRRVQTAGLSDKITLLKEDYRNLTGQYDKLISIEMVEAVGYEYLPTFFAKCNNLLKPNGIMAMQAITFNDQGYDHYLNSVDFIQSHIFPGGCLLSNQEILKQFTQESDMVVKSLLDYGYDYAHTLRDWRHAFMSHLEEIRAMGYDDTFIRLWHFYFAFCEGGFLEKTIGVVQVKAVKPDYR